MSADSAAAAPALPDPQELLARAEAVLAAAPGGAEVEVTVRAERQGLTRFARNRIHQNVEDTETTLRVRLQRDGRAGAATVPASRPDAAELVLRRAEEACRLAPEGAPSPLPPPQRGDDSRCGWSDATAAASPEDRAAAVTLICAEGTRHGVDTFGACSTSAAATAMASTTGLRRAAHRTRAGLVVVARGEDGGGYAAAAATDASTLDPAAVGAEAVDVCRRNQDATALDPGDYEVVLSPHATAELLSYAAYMGFSALAKQEQRSFLRAGERVMHEIVTIRDDPTDPALNPFPFDGEGVTTRPVTFVDHGVCREWAYDTPTALRDGVESTGHSLPQPNTFGPWAGHVVMDGGDAAVDDLVAQVRRGLLITRFWYIRAVHDLRTVVTGMTREGTFLIENGRVVHPVRDLRFTQSIAGAFSDVRGLSRDRGLVLDDDRRAVLAPWVHLGRFTFTS